MGAIDLLVSKFTPSIYRHLFKFISLTLNYKSCFLVQYNFAMNNPLMLVQLNAPVGFGRHLLIFLFSVPLFCLNTYNFIGKVTIQFASGFAMRK